MEELKTKQNILNSQHQGFTPNNSKPKPNRHVSVLYGMQYLTRVPVVKRCRKTQYECFANINKKQIFSLVYNFVQNILTSQAYLKKVFSQMKFTDNQFETTIIQSRPNNKRCSILQEKSFNSIKCGPLQQTIEKKFINFQQQKNGLLKVNNNKGKSCKKISIMMDQCFEDFDDKSSSSVLFSDQSITNLSSINISEQQFTLKMVQKIYEQPQPFLINLSVCLMLKYLFLSSTKLSNHNVCWILSIGTIVAYKIYYDEPVEGLIDSFAYILKIKRDDIINLQRYFLSAINHQAVISNHQYHSALYQIIRQGQSQN